MAKLFGKQRTTTTARFAFVLGMTVFGLMGISCTNLADTVEGSTTQNTGDGNENNENNSLLVCFDKKKQKNKKGKNNRQKKKIFRVL